MTHYRADSRVESAEEERGRKISRKWTQRNAYVLYWIFEQQAGTAKDQLVAVATGYRDLAKTFKETRAGVRAAADFARLKRQLETPRPGTTRS